MALNAAIVWEVQASGTHVSDNNGGGFKTGATGTDYTQGAGQTHIDIADLATDAANLNVMVSAGRNFVAADVGNLVHVISGTHATAGWYEITSVAANKATVDRNFATENNADHADGVAILGGALASPGGLGKVLTDHGVAGMQAWIKAGTYTLASASANVATGTLSLPSAKELKIEGYQTTRGDRTGTKPIISAGAIDSVTIVKTAGAYSGNNQMIANIAVDGNSRTAIIGFHINGTYTDTLYLCDASNCTTVGFKDAGSGAPYGECIACKTTSCQIGFQVSHCHGCVAIGSTSYGFNPGGQSSMSHCLAHGGSATGFSGGTFPTNWINCTSDSNSGASSDGFNVPSYGEIGAIVNCLATNNGRYGFNTAVNDYSIWKCAGYNNTGGNTNVTPLFSEQIIAVTADPYVNLGSHDFRPNNAASGGALLRTAGIGAAGQTNYADIGAVQHTPDYPAVGNVTADDTVNDVTGTYHEATAAEVQSGVQFGAGGTEYTGTYGGGSGTFMPRPIQVGV